MSNKLLADAGDGVPVLVHTVRAALASNACLILVVVRPGDDAMRVALTACSATQLALVDNEDFAEGMSSSIRTGISALTGAFDLPDHHLQLSVSCKGVGVLPGDMPLMCGDVLDDLIEAFYAQDGARVIVPTIHAEGGGDIGRLEQRNPVIWPRAFWPKLSGLSGDRGGKALLQAVPAEQRLSVAFEDAMPFMDVDTQEGLLDLAKARQSFSRPGGS